MKLSEKIEMDMLLEIPMEWEQLFPDVAINATEDQYATLAPISENLKNVSIVQPKLHFATSAVPEMVQFGDDVFASWLDEKVDLSSLMPLEDKLDPSYDLNAIAGEEVSLMNVLDGIVPLDGQLKSDEPEKLIDSFIAEFGSDDDGYTSSTTPRPTSPESIFNAGSPLIANVHPNEENDAFVSCLNNVVLFDLPVYDPKTSEANHVTVEPQSNHHLVVDVKQETPVRKERGAGVAHLTSQRSKPYSKPGATNSLSKSRMKKSERFERKKNQNKEAATRYREKKRAEANALFGEEEELAKINTDLKDRVNSLSTEVNYLKSLMKEILVAKGLME